MNTNAERPLAVDWSELRTSIPEVGVGPAGTQELREVLDKALFEARKLARAEGGALFVLEKDRLRLAATQSDRLGSQAALRELMGRTVPLSTESLVGFAAMTGRAMNVEDAYALPPDTPFRIRREFDLATGRKTRSILAIPIICPRDECIGVMELFDRADEGGRPVPFPEVEDLGILPLVSMAAVMLHNCLLQDRLREAHMDTIIRLSMAAEYRDDDTGTHVCRIGYTSSLIARAIGLDAHQVNLIFSGSPMHDVGKIGIPDRVLLKPGPLTAAERKLVQEHTWIGARILGRPSNELIATALEIALSHHERWDGKGYPRNLPRQDIPLSGRIVCVADVFDALVSKRCYKEAYPLDQALGIMRGDREKNFGPDVVDAFFSALDEILDFYELVPSAQREARQPV